MRCLIPELCLGVILVCSGCDSSKFGLKKHTPAPPDPVLGRAILTWETPTTDLEARCTNIIRYKIHYGQNSHQYSHIDDVWLNSDKVTCINTNMDKDCGLQKRTCSYSIENLKLGTWYFSIQSISDQGEESFYSNEVIKEITATKTNDI